MECLECGAPVRSINFMHLKSCCGMTPQAYRAKHPDAVLIDDDVRRAISRPGESNPNWQGGRTIKHCECGKRLARGNRSGLCASCCRRGDRNPFLGKRHSTGTRLRMRDSHQTRDPSTYRGGGADSILLSSLRRREWEARTPEERTRHLQAFIAAGQVHNRKASKTKIEMAVAEMLDAMGVTYRQNAQLGRYNVDFLIGATVVECFGDFWHCNPARWAPGTVNRSLRMTAAEKWRKDLARQQKLEARGYQFVVFWEAEIVANPDGVRSRLRALTSM